MVSAVEDALRDYDARVNEIPMTPSRVWEAIRAATAKGSPADRLRQ